ncbi:hypothetical protein G7Y79_00045g081130 [Physcia stellaris]|nr:hypothetical protein G7Y79_00045g081130 [Physcia stellaris]
MSDSTFHTTREDIRKPESKVSHKGGGHVPSSSEPSQMKSIVDQNQEKSKKELIDERQAGLPLPDQPPVASDWNSSDESKVNVGSGRLEEGMSYGNDALREPATSDSNVRTDGAEFSKNTAAPSGVGREGHDNLGGLPKDART